MIDISRRGMLKAAALSSAMLRFLPKRKRLLSPFRRSGTVRRMYSLSAPALLA